MIYRRGTSSPALFLQGGFTLLEMMVVLFIGGLAIALVAPRFNARIEDYERGFQRKTLEDSLRVLPRRVRMLGRSLNLPEELSLQDLGDGHPPLVLPEGWSLRAEPSLFISSLGACTKSRLEIGSGLEREVFHYTVAEFSCELVSQ